MLSAFQIRLEAVPCGHSVPVVGPGFDGDSARGIRQWADFQGDSHCAVGGRLALVAEDDLALRR